MTRDSLLELIHDAFYAPWFPQAPNFEPTSEAWDETGEFWGKPWDSIGIGLFQKCSHVFAFVPDEHFPLFLGRFLYLSVKLDRHDILAFELYADFWFDMEDEGEKGRREFSDSLAASLSSRLDRQQKNALRQYVGYRGKHIGSTDNQSAENMLNAILSQS